MTIAKRIFDGLLPSVLLTLLLSGKEAVAQNTKQSAQVRLLTPTRDPHTPGYVTATDLPDGTNPSQDSCGNFIIGPTHNPAAETVPRANVPQGTVYQFTMNSLDSKFYPGIAREPNTFGTVDPADPG